MKTPAFIKTTGKLLTQAEELDLFERWNTARDANNVLLENRLFEQIVKQYSPIAIKLSRKMAGYGLDPEDIMGEALAALSQAVLDFDSSKGFRFGTYANSCVINSLYTYVVKNYFMTNVCSNSKNKKVFFRLRRLMSEQIRLNGNTEITPEVIQSLADQLEVSTDIITMMATILRDPYSSLNQPVGDDEDGGGGLTQQDLLVSREEPQEQQIEKEQLRILHEELVMQALATLDDRTRNIVIDQVLQPEGHRITLEELGERYQISKERARQVRDRGLQKINKFVRWELSQRRISSVDLFMP